MAGAPKGQDREGNEDVVAAGAEQGYFSVLRWRPDVTRDEPRNIAIILAGDAGQFAAVRPIPVSSFSPKLHEQGLLDAVLVSLKQKVEEGPFSVEEIRELATSLSGPLLVTEPRPVAVHDVDATLRALYRAFVAVRSGRGRGGQTKGLVLDKVVNSFRRAGWAVRRGAYIATTSSSTSSSMMPPPRARRGS